MLCPLCKIELAMTDRQGIEIDYCPGCRGVWLDRGELDKIIERTVQDAQPAVPPPPSRGAGYQSGAGHQPYQADHHYNRKHKKKSLLGELFDF